MAKKLIKASPIQRDPQFLELLNSGQRGYKRFIKEAKANTDWSDIEVIDRYIMICDAVIGVFKDDEYELGWGLYFIKGQSICMRIINAGKAEKVSFGVIPCRMLEEAVVFSQRCGDIKQAH